MRWSLIGIVLSGLLTAMLALPAVFAAGGPIMEQSVDLNETMSGTLAPGAETWYKIWDNGTKRALGVVMRFEPYPAKADNSVSFNVWITQRKNWMETETLMIATATDSGLGAVGMNPGIKYWRGGSDIVRTYFLQVYNNSDQQIDYSLMFAGETYPPPTPLLGALSAVQAVPAPDTAGRVAGPTVLGRPPVPTIYRNATYVVSDTLQVGAYTIRTWLNEGPMKYPADSIVTINAPDQAQVQVEMVGGENPLTIKELTGNGIPSAIIETFTGGAHCCASVVVYEIGPRLTKILESKESNCGVKFEDLEGKGVFTGVTCDDSFADKYCSFASSPLVKVLLRYVPGLGYQPDSPNYPDQYAADIQQHLVLAATGQPGANGERDDTNKCSVLPLTLDYLYSGEADQARLTVEQFYIGPDLEEWWADIQQTISKSMLYVP
jgi:hypothetical protein